MRWAGFLGKRLAKYVLVVWLVSLLIFVMMRLSGDPVAIMAGLTATEETREAIRRELGLNHPIYIQYLHYILDVFHLNFGTSIAMAQGTPSSELVLNRIPKTLALLGTAVGFAFLIGGPVGMLSATKQGTYADMAGMLIALLGQSIPSFWLGLLLIIYVAANISFFPIGGAGSWRHLILPGFTLSVFLMSSIARLTRSSMVDVLDEEFIKTARSKGITERVVYVSHALRNAIIPVISFVGVQTAYLIGGAVITEFIFAYPGMGRLAIQAILARDFPVVQAIVFYTVFMVIIINFSIDLLYLKLDPRISYGERG